MPSYEMMIKNNCSFGGNIMVMLKEETLLMYLPVVMQYLHTEFWDLL